MALKNSQYDTITRIYNQKQLRNRHNQTKRQEEIYEKIPRIHEIDDNIASISVKRAKELLNGNASALSDLHQELEELAEEKRLLLLRSGFSENYLKMQYECPDCQDTGYCNGKKCHCFQQASIDMLYAQSNIKGLLKTENFQNFTLEYYDDQEVNPMTGKTQKQTMTEIYNTCRTFVENFGNSYENLFFYGDPGLGKTFFSNCIAKELLDRSFCVIYLSAIELFELFSRTTFSEDTAKQSELPNELQQFIMECDLLIIDDLGTEFTNSFTNSNLFYCLNTRYLHKKSTLISTNLTMNKISDMYTERIFSRIFSNYTMLKFFGTDIRIKKKLLTKRS